MLPPAHIQIILQIKERLALGHPLWAVTGSTSFALQGLDVPVHDIDIQTDADGAYFFARLFSEYLLASVHFCGTDQIRSHFGRFLWDGILIEVMGDVQKPELDGTWGSPTDLLRWRRYVTLQDRQIPVLDLRYEADAYRRLGRLERAEQLERFCAGNRYDLVD